MNFLKINLKKILLVFICYKITYQETNEEFGCLKKNLFRTEKIINDSIFQKKFEHPKFLICREDDKEYFKFKEIIYQIKKFNIQKRENISIVKQLLINKKGTEYASFCNLIQDKIFIIKKATKDEIKNCIKLQNYSPFDYEDEISIICINQINNLFTKETKQQENVENFEKTGHLEKIADITEELAIGDKTEDDCIKKLSSNFLKDLLILQIVDI